MICTTHFKHFHGNYFLTKKWYERKQKSQASPTKKDTTRSACMAGHHHRNVWKYGDFVIWVKQPFDSTPDQWLVTLPFPLLTFGLSPIFSSEVIVGESRTSQHCWLFPGHQTGPVHSRFHACSGSISCWKMNPLPHILLGQKGSHASAEYTGISLWQVCSWVTWNSPTAQ